MLRRNLLIYGLGGLIVPVCGIKIDESAVNPVWLWFEDIVMTQLRPAIMMLLVILMLVTGGLYPVVTTLLGRWWFPLSVEGSPD